MNYQKLTTSKVVKTKIKFVTGKRSHSGSMSAEDSVSIKARF